MKENFPDAPVTETAGGHFLQEEVPVEIAAALLRVMDQIQLSPFRRAICHTVFRRGSPS
jgi:haloalkane dehalogenase